MLSDSDWEFIRLHGAYLPGLEQNFEDALDIDPKDRMGWTTQRLGIVYRDGWFANSNVAIQDAETVLEHRYDVVYLAGHLVPPKYREQAKNLLQVHDDTESIAHVILPTYGQNLRRDINHHTVYGVERRKINKSDKQRIEELAAGIIFEAFPAEKELWFEHEYQKSDAARYAHDIDKLHPYLVCVEYCNKFGYRSDEFQVFWEVAHNMYQSASVSDFAKHLYRSQVLPEKQRLLEREQNQLTPSAFGA